MPPRDRQLLGLALAALLITAALGAFALWCARPGPSVSFPLTPRPAATTPAK